MSSDISLDIDVIEAATQNDVRTLKAYLDQGGDPKAEFYFGYEYYTFSAMSEACGAKSYEAMDLLMMHGAMPDSEHDYDATIAHALALRGDVEAMEMLLNYEPDLKAVGTIWKKLPDGHNKYVPMTPRQAAESCGHDAIVELIDRHQSMPRIADMEQPVTKAQLLARDANGDCALDHPSTWRRFDEVVEALHVNGETLTKEDLLQTGGNGKSYLMKAAACNAGKAVLEMLNAQNEGLHSKELLDAAGEPSELAQIFLKKLTVEELFTPANWALSGKAELNKVYRALPEEAQQDVMNYHVLMAGLTEIPKGVGRSMLGGGY